MTKGDRIHEKVRRLCRDISHRADDSKKLLTLVVRLEEALREEQCENWTVRVNAPREADNPFDRILVA